MALFIIILTSNSSSTYLGNFLSFNSDPHPRFPMLSTSWSELLSKASWCIIFETSNTYPDVISSSFGKSVSFQMSSETMMVSENFDWKNRLVKYL